MTSLSKHRLPSNAPQEPGLRGRLLANAWRELQESRQQGPIPLEPRLGDPEMEQWIGGAAQVAVIGSNKRFNIGDQVGSEDAIMCLAFVVLVVGWAQMAVGKCKALARSGRCDGGALRFQCTVEEA